MGSRTVVLAVSTAADEEDSPIEAVAVVEVAGDFLIGVEVATAAIALVEIVVAETAVSVGTAAIALVEIVVAETAVSVGTAAVVVEETAVLVETVAVVVAETAAVVEDSIEIVEDVAVSAAVAMIHGILNCFLLSMNSINFIINLLVDKLILFNSE